MTMLSAFVHDDEGATAIEYSLIASLCAIIAIAGLSLFSGAMQSMFSEINSHL